MTESETKLVQAITMLKPFLNNPTASAEQLENISVGAELVAHLATVAQHELKEQEGVVR